MPIKAMFGKQVIPNPVTLHNGGATANGNGTGPVSAIYTLSSDGNIYNQNGTNIGTWLASGSALNYECRADITSGSLTSGTTGSWVTPTQSWKLTCPAGSDLQTVFTLQVRDAAAPNTVRGSATITLTCNNTP